MLNKVFTLKLDDVMDGLMPVKVRNMRFDAEVNVEIRRVGYDSMEVDSITVGPINVVAMYDLSGDLSNSEYLMLDQEQLRVGRRSLYNEIVSAFEEAALKKAASVPDYMWEVEDYSVVPA